MLTITNIKTKETRQLSRLEADLPVSFLHENGQHRFVYSAERGSQPRLFISEVELTASYTRVTQEGVYVEWNWNIEEYAGEARISLSDGGSQILEVRVDIAPNPFKLGAEIHRDLLLDLQAKAEGVLWGTTQAHFHFGEANSETPPIAKFVLLRSHFGRLMRAFCAIEEAPHRLLVAQRHEQSLPKVRRVDARSIRSALKRMPVLAGLTNRTNVGHATIDVPRREHTFDTSPNRYLLGLLVRLVSLCGDLSDRFEFASSSNQEETMVQQRARRWAEETRRFQGHLMRLTKAKFFDGLKPANPDTAALMAVSRHPAYSQFDRLARKILRPRVDVGEDSKMSLGLRPTYDIYEYWCFFAVVEAAKQVLPNAVWKSSVSISPGRLLLEIQNGSHFSTVVDGLNVSITFQESYSRSLNRHGHFSISKRCVPDIVLTIENSSSVRTVVFDAKYRSSFESIREALADIHVYRDAIRSDPHSTAIDAAFILTPSHHPKSNRYYSAKYRDTFAFGGVDLLPGNDHQLAVLGEVISNYLKDSDNV